MELLPEFLRSPDPTHCSTETKTKVTNVTTVVADEQPYPHVPDEQAVLEEAAQNATLAAERAVINAKAAANDAAVNFSPNSTP